MAAPKNRDELKRQSRSSVGSDFRKKAKDDIIDTVAGATSPSVEGNFYNKLRHLEPKLNRTSKYAFIIPSISLFMAAVRKTSVEKVEGVKDELARRLQATLAKLQRSRILANEAQIKSVDVDFAVDVANVDISKYSMNEILMPTYGKESGLKCCPPVLGQEKVNNFGTLRLPFVFPIGAKSTTTGGDPKTVYEAVMEQSLKPESVNAKKKLAPIANWAAITAAPIDTEDRGLQMAIASKVLDVASVFTTSLPADAEDSIGGLKIGDPIFSFMFFSEGIFDDTPPQDVVALSGFTKGARYRPGLNGLTDATKDAAKESWLQGAKVYASYLMTLGHIRSKYIKEKDDGKGITSANTTFSYEDGMASLAGLLSAKGDTKKKSPMLDPGEALVPEVVRERKALDGSTLVNRLNRTDVLDIFGKMTICHYKKPPLVEMKSVVVELEPASIAEYCERLQAPVLTKESSAIYFGFGNDGFIPLNMGLKGRSGVMSNTLGSFLSLFSNSLANEVVGPVGLKPEDFTNLGVVWDTVILAALGRRFGETAATVTFGNQPYSIWVPEEGKVSVTCIDPATGTIVSNDTIQFKGYVTKVTPTKLTPSKTLDDAGEIIDNPISQTDVKLDLSNIRERMIYEDPTTGQYTGPISQLPREAVGNISDLIKTVVTDQLKLDFSSKLEQQSPQFSPDLASRAFRDLIGDVIGKTNYVNSQAAFTGRAIEALRQFSGDNANKPTEKLVNGYVNLKVAIDEIEQGINIATAVVLMMMNISHLNLKQEELALINDILLGSVPDASIPDTANSGYVIRYDVEEWTLSLNDGRENSSRSRAVPELLAAMVIQNETIGGKDHKRIPIGFAFKINSVYVLVDPFGSPVPEIESIVRDSVDMKVIYRSAKSHPKPLFLHMQFMRQVLELYGLARMLDSEIYQKEFVGMPETIGVTSGNAIPGKSKKVDTKYSVLKEMFNLYAYQAKPQPPTPTGTASFVPMYPVVLNKVEKPKDITDFDKKATVDLSAITTDTLYAGQLIREAIPKMGYRILGSDISKVGTGKYSRYPFLAAYQKDTRAGTITLFGELAGKNLLRAGNSIRKALDIKLEGDTYTIPKDSLAIQNLIDIKPIAKYANSTETREDEMKDKFFFDIATSDILCRPVVIDQTGSLLGDKKNATARPGFVADLNWVGSPIWPIVGIPFLNDPAIELSDEYSGDSIKNAKGDAIESLLIPWHEQILNPSLPYLNDNRKLHIDVLLAQNLASTIQLGTGTTPVKITDFASLVAAKKVISVRDLSFTPICITGKSHSFRGRGMNVFPYNMDAANEDLYYKGSTLTKSPINTGNTPYAPITAEDIIEPASFLWSNSDIGVSRRKAFLTAASYLEELMKGCEFFPTDDAKNRYAGVYRKVLSAPADDKTYSAVTSVWIKIPGITEVTTPAKRAFKLFGLGGIANLGNKTHLKGARLSNIYPVTGGFNQLDKVVTYVDAAAQGKKDLAGLRDEIEKSLNQTMLDLVTDLSADLKEMSKKSSTQLGKGLMMNLMLPAKGDERPSAYTEKYTVEIDINEITSKSTLYQILGNPDTLFANVRQVLLYFVSKKFFPRLSEWLLNQPLYISRPDNVSVALSNGLWEYTGEVKAPENIQFGENVYTNGKDYITGKYRFSAGSLVWFRAVLFLFGWVSDLPGKSSAAAKTALVKGGTPKETQAYQNVQKDLVQNVDQVIQNQSTIIGQLISGEPPEVTGLALLTEIVGFYVTLIDSAFSAKSDNITLNNNKYTMSSLLGVLKNRDITYMNLGYSFLDDSELGTPQNESVKAQLDIQRLDTSASYLDTTFNFPLAYILKYADIGEVTTTTVKIPGSIAGLYVKKTFDVVPIDNKIGSKRNIEDFILAFSEYTGPSAFDLKGRWISVEPQGKEHRVTDYTSGGANTDPDGVITSVLKNTDPRKAASRFGIDVYELGRLYMGYKFVSSEIAPKYSPYASIPSFKDGIFALPDTAANAVAGLVLKVAGSTDVITSGEVKLTSEPILKGDALKTALGDTLANTLLFSAEDKPLYYYRSMSSKIPDIYKGVVNSPASFGVLIPSPVDAIRTSRGPVKQPGLLGIHMLSEGSAQKNIADHLKSSVATIGTDDNNFKSVTLIDLEWAYSVLTAEIYLSKDQIFDKPVPGTTQVVEELPAIEPVITENNNRQVPRLFPANGIAAEKKKPPKSPTPTPAPKPGGSGSPLWRSLKIKAANPTTGASDLLVASINESTGKIYLDSRYPVKNRLLGDVRTYAESNVDPTPLPNDKFGRPQGLAGFREVKKKLLGAGGPTPSLV